MIKILLLINYWKYLINFLKFFYIYVYFNVIRDLSSNEIEAIPTSISNLTKLKDL